MLPRQPYQGHVAVALSTLEIICIDLFNSSRSSKIATRPYGSGTIDLSKQRNTEIAQA